MLHERKLLQIAGPDRVRFLGDLLTIAISDHMTPRYGALLTPQGKILADLFVFGEEGAILLDLPISEYETIKTRLGLYRLRAKVEFADDPRQIFQLPGKGDPRGDIGARAYLAPGQVPESAMAAQEYLERRVNQLIPEFGIDFGPNEAYPIEWRFSEMQGIDYDKGCYVGQEIAARMRHKTELQKSIKRFRISGNARIGDKITSSGREIGKLLSQHEDRAMGFVRLKRLNEAQAQLEAGEAQLELDE